MVSTHARPCVVDGDEVRRVRRRAGRRRVERRDEREHALGRRAAREPWQPRRAAPARRESPARVCTWKPCNGALDGLAPARLVGGAGRPQSTRRPSTREQRLRERPAVGAARALVRERRHRLDQPGWTQEVAVAEQSSAGRVERGAAVERHHRLEHRQAARVRAAASARPRGRAAAPARRGAATAARPPASWSALEAGRNPGHAARGRPDRVVDDLLAERDGQVDHLAAAARAQPRSSRGSRARRPSHQMAWPPPSRPVMTVSATQDARHIATAASAAVPPSARISAPAWAVAGMPPPPPPPACGTVLE